MKLDYPKKILLYLFKRENLYPIGICVAVLGFLWFTIFGHQGLYQLHKSHKLKKELKRDIVQLKNKIEELKTKKGLLNDPAHLELIIREELGYIKPGETVFQKTPSERSHTGSPVAP